MTGTQTQPQPGTRDYSIQTPQRDLGGSRFIFSVADMISATVKASNPDWMRGGMILEGSQTLKWCNGYIPRCEIREMRQFMDSDRASLVHPAERKHHDTQYTMTAPNPLTGDMETRIIGNDGLLRTAFYPIWEVGVLTSQVDGVVEMPVKNASERDAAQNFLFPTWGEIKDTLPRKLTQIRTYFMQRLAAAQKANEPFYINVALAAIRSCDNFKAWGDRFIRTQNARFSEAEKKGWAWTYGEDAECCFEQLGIARRDLMQQEQSDKMEALIASQTAFTENTAKILEKLADRVVTPAPVVEDTVADTPPPAAPQEPVQTVVEPVQEPLPNPSADGKCLATTKNGDRCKNDAGLDGFCSAPTHNAEAEGLKVSDGNEEENIEK